MRMMMVLVAIWLTSQYGAMILSGAWTSHDAGSDARRVETILADWPASARSVAEKMIAELGPPDGVFEDRLRWTRAGQLALILYRENGTARSPSVIARNQSSGPGRDTH